MASRAYNSSYQQNSVCGKHKEECLREIKPLSCRQSCQSSFPACQSKSFLKSAAWNEENLAFGRHVWGSDSQGGAADFNHTFHNGGGVAKYSEWWALSAIYSQIPPLWISNLTSFPASTSPCRRRGRADTELGFQSPSHSWDSWVRDGQHTLVCWNSWWVAGVVTCRYCPSLQSWTSPFQKPLIQGLTHCYLCCSSLPAGVI